MESKIITRMLLVAGMIALLLASSAAGLAVGPSAPTTAQATAAPLRMGQAEFRVSTGGAVS